MSNTLCHGLFRVHMCIAVTSVGGDASILPMEADSAEGGLAGLSEEGGLQSCARRVEGSVKPAGRKLNGISTTVKGHI